jgi:spermidine/putrescine transport system permease protein
VNFAFKKRFTWAVEWIVSAPSVIWLMLFFAVPSILVLLISFHAPTSDGGINPEWSLSTWQTLVKPNYPTIVGRTLFISAAATAGCVLLALPCAYAIATMPRRWRAITAGLIMLPFWTSFVVRVFAWRVLLHPEGFIKQTLTFLHITAPDTQLLYNSGAVLLVSIYTFLPFAIMPIYAAAEKFDFSLVEAARDLGARSFTSFCKVFIPGIRRGLIAAVLMVFIPSIGSYVIPDLVGGKSGELIGNKIYQRTFPDRNLPHASALSALMTIGGLLPLALIAWLLKRKEELATGKQPSVGAHVPPPGKSGGSL